MAGDGNSASAGIVPIDNLNLSASIPISDALNNLGASSATSSSSASVDFGGWGDINIASGKSTAGSFGTVKTTAFIVLALAGLVALSFLSGKKGGKGVK